MLTYKQFLKENEENEEQDDTIHYPGGVYVSVKIREESAIALSEYMNKYLPGYDTVKLEKLHCTLIYSKKEHKEIIEPNEYDAIGTYLHFSKFGKEGETLVAEIKCDTLVERNKNLVKEYGFISDFDKYLPHFTLVYDAQDIDVNSLPPLDFVIHFHDETVEALDTDWANKDTESNDESGTLVGKALNTMKKEDKKEENKEENKEEKE